MIDKEQYDNLIKYKNDGDELSKDQLNQINEYESTTLKEKGDKYIPPTSYGDLNYADIMQKLNKSASTPEDIEKFKSMLADKIMHDESFNVVKFAKMVKLGDDKNRDGQYSYEEIIRSPDFQRFLTDMQAQSQKEQIAKDFDKDMRYYDSDTDEDRDWLENFGSFAADVFFPTTLEKIKRGGYAQDEVEPSVLNSIKNKLPDFITDKLPEDISPLNDMLPDLAITSAETLPIGLGAGKLIGKILPSIFKSEAIKKGVAKAITGAAMYGAAPTARSGLNQHINREDFDPVEFAGDASRGALLNYAAPHAIDMVVGKVKEFVPAVKQALDKAMEKRNIGREINDLLNQPAGRYSTKTAMGKPRVSFLNKDINKLIEDEVAMQPNLQNIIIRSEDLNKFGTGKSLFKNGILKQPIFENSMRGAYTDETLAKLNALRDKTPDYDYLNFIKELKAKDNRFADKLTNADLTDIAKEITNIDVPISYNAVFDANKNINPSYLNKLKEKGLNKYSAAEIPEVQQALRAPRTAADNVIGSIVNSDKLNNVADATARLFMNRLGQSESGRSLGSGMWDFLPDIVNKNEADKSKADKSKADKSGRSYKGDTNNIQAIQKARDERWADGFATFAEKNTPEYQTWLAENITHLAD
jgi:hypothetical protein